MPYELIAAVIAGVIAVLLLLLRTNAGVVFFSVCAGSVLAEQLAGDASLMTSVFIKNGDINLSVASIALIILPALLSALFLVGTVTPGKLLFNIVPSVAAGALMVLLVVPALPPSVSGQLLDSQLWGGLQRLQPLILVGGVISSTFFMWLTRHKTKQRRRRSKK